MISIVTEKLLALVQDEKKFTAEESSELCSSLKRVWISCGMRVSNPLGGPLTDVINYRYSVFVAGGIGITPFIAVINHLK